MSFQGSGILRGMQAIADVRGLVKGKVGNPKADPPLRPDGKLNVGEAVGRGALRLRPALLLRSPSVSSLQDAGWLFKACSTLQ